MEDLHDVIPVDAGVPWNPCGGLLLRTHGQAFIALFDVLVDPLLYIFYDPGCILFSLCSMLSIYLVDVLLFVACQVLDKEDGGCNDTDDHYPFYQLHGNNISPF